MICDQIIDKCLSSRLRRRLLLETDLTLEISQNLARSLETVESQAAEMEMVNP